MIAAIKAAVGCIMTLDPRISEWDNPLALKMHHAVRQRKRRELKNLVPCRNRKPNVISPSSGERPGLAQTSGCFGIRQRDRTADIAEKFYEWIRHWKMAIIEVTIPYMHSTCQA